MATYNNFDPSVLMHVLLHLQGYFHEWGYNMLPVWKYLFNKEPHHRENAHFSLNGMDLHVSALV